MDLRRWSLAWFVALLLVIGISTPTADAALLISEVYYDHPGSDSDHEFLELFNAGIQPIDLGGWLVEWVGVVWGEQTLALSGMALPGRFFLIGGANTVLDFGVTPDLLAALVLQNGGSATDGVRIRKGSYTDTVLYDAPNTAVLAGDGGWSGASFAPDVAMGRSLARWNIWSDTNEMTDFVERVVPGPSNRFAPGPSDGTVPEPASALMTMMGMGWLLWRRHR